jgi:hypothetical protein
MAANANSTMNAKMSSSSLRRALMYAMAAATH